MIIVIICVSDEEDSEAGAFVLESILDWIGSEIIPQNINLACKWKKKSYLAVSRIEAPCHLSHGGWITFFYDLTIWKLMLLIEFK